MKGKTFKISALAIIFLALVLGAVLGAFAGCTPKTVLSEFTNQFKTKTSVGYSAEVLGTVERHIPNEVKDEGLDCGYPVYGTKLNLTTEEKLALIGENKMLTGVKTSTGGSYDQMNSEGYLFLEGNPVMEGQSQRKLYKHTGSVGLFGGDVSNSEEAIIKRVTFKKRGYDGYGVTGVYAPAGEVIKIEISKADMEATGGITIHIGQALFNGQANNIWEKKDFVRMPVILNTMEVNEKTATLDGDVYTAYVGSFLGGPLYVRNENVTFSVTISGGVRYSHFILGYTTEKEFDQNAKSSAPYFDLEVWSYGVLHSGPKSYAKDFSYEDLYKAAVYWDKVALVSNQITSQGIVFLYDPFVAAGAAVAFPGRRSVNCPAGWMSASLNYNAMVSTGAWGNMHEYNHNFQSGWGFEGGGEVTNNAVNLVEYSLFTKISSNRQIDNYGAANLSDWNRYTSATWALNQALSYPRENDLSIYSTVLHNFGPEMFINAIKEQHANKIGVSKAGWCEAVSLATHNDMTYFFSSLVPNYSVTDAVKTKIQEKGYPTFIPIATVYQTGRSFNFDNQKKYFTSQAPYQIEYGKEFTMDLSRYFAEGGMHKSGSVILPNGFDYTIKSVSAPDSGTITKVDDLTYKYMPGEEIRSGKIIVTVEITPPEGSNLVVSDVDLVVEFEQTKELNKNMLERTFYTFDSPTYTNAKEAYLSGYEGSVSSRSEDNKNSVQNSNTDIWYSEAPNPNEIVEIRGKLYAEEDGKYRVALRGRFSTALFISVGDDKNFELAAEYNQTATQTGFPQTTGTFKDYELKGGTWLYFKEVLINKTSGRFHSFIGLGFGKFTPAVPELDSDGNPTGNVAIPESIAVKYANAYRNSFEFGDSHFESEYFYTRDYTYDYAEVSKVGKNAEIIDSYYKQWTDGVTAGTFDIEHLIDEDPNTNVHTAKENLGSSNPQDRLISSDNPVSFTIDMGREVRANQITFFAYSTGSGNHNLGLPRDFEIKGSHDNEEYYNIVTVEDKLVDTKTMTVEFTETTFRYFTLTVTRTDNERYFALNGMQFAYIIPTAKQLNLDDEMFTFKGNWQTKSELSSFGHTYLGQSGDTLEFEWTGTRLAILNSLNYGRNFEVYIDGEKVNLTKYNDDKNNNLGMQITNTLTSKRHKVKVVLRGGVALDSIALW